LRIALLGDEPIHRAGAPRLLRVIDRTHADPCILFEIPEDRLGKNLVMADVDDYVLAVARGIEAPHGAAGDDDNEQKQNAPDPFQNWLRLAMFSAREEPDIVAKLV
jgi:hypothetical protein